MLWVHNSNIQGLFLALCLGDYTQYQESTWGLLNVNLYLFTISLAQFQNFLSLLSIFNTHFIINLSMVGKNYILVF